MYIDPTCTIFDEDEVCIPISTGGFKYGLVVESSEYISSDDDDDEYENRVQKGTVKVAWHPSGEEIVVAEKKLILTDRSLMPGDVVRRLISEKESQCGFIESISSKCHVKIVGTEQWIYNVNLEDISTMQEWDPESEVTLDSWVGQLYEVREDITVRFPDGARCILKDAGMLDLEDANDKRADLSEFVMRNFYPGQELCGSKEDYEGATWLHTTQMRGPDSLGAKPLYSVPVVVEKVETSGVEVRWLCKGFTKAGSEKDVLDIPPRHVEGENLKRMKVMDCFKHLHHEIGDKGYYVVQETDTVLRGMSPRQHYTPDIIQKMSSDNLTVIGTSKDGIVIAKKKTDIEDTKKNENPSGPVENGIEKRSETGSIIVNNNADENDGDDEGEDGDDDNDDEDHDDNVAQSGNHSSTTVRSRNRKRAFLKSGKTLKKLRGRQPKKKLKLPERTVNPGDKVPIEIWYTYTTCKVMWQDGTTEDKIPSPELFPIHHLDEFEYFPGDFVIDAKSSTGTDYGVIVSCDHKERTCMVKWMKPYFPGKSQRPEEGETTEVSVYDIKDHPDYKYRPGNTVIRVGGFEGTSEDLEAVGQVYKLDSDGSVHIWWPNDTITKTYPQDLFLITDDMSGVNSSDGWPDSGEEEEVEEEEGESDISWETEGEESTDTETEEEKEEEAKKDNQSKPIWTCDDEKKKDLDELLRRLQAAISGLLDIFQKVSGPFFKNSKHVFQDILEIFKKCKEMEKIMKSSFFKESEIFGLISEIKEELRKENTSKLAKHVATLYKYRNAVQHNDTINKEEVNDSASINAAEISGNKGINGLHDESTSQISDDSHSCNSEQRITHTTQKDQSEFKKEQNPSNDSSELGAADNACSNGSGFEVVTIGSAGDGTSQEDTTEQKLRKALVDYGTHIEDPILQIIFDTALHLAVAKSATKEVEAKDSACNSLTKTESQENSANNNGKSDGDKGSERNISNAQAVKYDKIASDGSVLNVVESIMSVCSGDRDSAEVTALKNSAKRKVEEMCFNALSDSQSAPGLDVQTQTALGQDIGVQGLNIHGKGSESSSSHTESEAGSRTESQDISNSKACTDNKFCASTEKSELPSNHRNLCIRICKALNSRLYLMQQELNRKWLAYKFGCDENATDKEIYEQMQAKMIESHEKFGRPLSLSDLTGSQEVVETKSDKLATGKKDEIDTAEADGEKRDKKAVVKSEVDSEETGATANADNGNYLERPSGFELCSSVCSSHWFKFQEQKPTNQKAFTSAVRKELMSLQSSLPAGILVKAFEDRMDLFAVMVVGPAKTPYEDGLFAFDVQLPANFPISPPVFHYLSYCNERLNPNLYEDGKVCVSLLGTWSGKGSEMWTSKSSLLQVLVSIQGLILVSEPYFNEAGYKRQRGSQHGQENSRMYNEMAVLKLVQSMTKMALTPPKMFAKETKDHLNKHGARMIERLASWIELSSSQRKVSDEVENQSQDRETGTSQKSRGSQPCDNISSQADRTDLPDFPLLPASKGFCLTLKKHLDNFKTVLKEHIWKKDLPDH